MNILHIISSPSAGGAEIYVRDLSRQMVAQGHRVCVAYVSEAAALGRCAEFASSFKQSLYDAGIETAEIGHAGRKNLLYGGWRLRQIIRSFQPDMIHSHLYYGLFFKLLSFSSVPLIYTHHNHRLGKGRHLYPLFKRVVKSFVGISRDCTHVLEQVGATPVTTIYNGVSVERLQIKNYVSSTDGPLSLLAVGALSPQKNFSLLVEACARLVQQNPDMVQRFHLRIAGEGPLREPLQQQIDQLGLNVTIELLGNRSDVPLLLHDADLFVMSSDWEGLPIALLEALLTGVPVVVTDVGGCKDVVETCQAGLIVPPGDSKAVADAIKTLVMDSVLRRRFSENAREKAQQFSIETACREHLELYEEAGMRKQG